MVSNRTMHRNGNIGGFEASCMIPPFFPHRHPQTPFVLITISLSTLKAVVLPPPPPSPFKELGIDLAGILLKTRAVLLHRLKSKYLDDLDMGGALLFIAVLGGLHLLVSCAG